MQVTPGDDACMVSYNGSSRGIGLKDKGSDI